MFSFLSVILQSELKVTTSNVSYLQQHSAVGVDIGPGVLGLTLLQQHVGHNLVKLGDQFEHGVVGQVLQGKLTLAGVTWVGLPQDGVAITGHNLRRRRTRSSQSLNCTRILYSINLCIETVFKCPIKKEETETVSGSKEDLSQVYHKG